MQEALVRVTRFYTTREWRTAAALFVSYVVTYALAAWILPDGARFNPASAIALSTLYFRGVRLWPVVYISTLTATFVSGSSVWGLAFLPLFEVLQAIAGSWLLQYAHIDPLFRRYRDTFYFLVTIAGISLITPTCSILVRTYRHLPDPMLTWWHSYVATFFCFIIVTPFLLRWFTKPRFSRTPLEIAEITVVFTLLLSLDLLLFVRGIESFIGIPLINFLLIPLFWIALRLRPRFVSLALLLTSVCAITSVALQIQPPLVIEYLFQSEILLITLAIVFYIITSLEEDRRVNTNIMQSHMATLRNAVARESSESQAKNDFIAILSHELRNPLAPIVSSIDLLKLKGPRDEEEAEILNIMEDRMSTVRRLLDDLLDISRISEGKAVLTKKSVHLSTVLKRAVVSTEHHRKELHQRLVLKIPQKVPHVLGDVVRLEQVFSNLLTNASKYSASGDTITLSLREHTTHVEIEVADQGIGLQPQELETIFIPFHQISENDCKKGLGIGLTLVRNFVELHGGNIEARSEGTGRGSRFIVTLPTITPGESVPHKTTLDGDVRRGRGPHKNPRIVIIDDNDAAAGGVGRLLEFHGARVSYAYDGAQGIVEALTVLPDVIFLDIGLPDQSGHQVAETLRAKGFTGKLIALSGHDMNPSQNKDSKKYFDQYLVKPVSLANLQRALQGIL